MHLIIGSATHIFSVCLKRQKHSNVPRSTATVFPWKNKHNVDKVQVSANFLVVKNMLHSPQRLVMKAALTKLGLTSLPQMFSCLRLSKRSHLIELGVDAGMLEAPEMDALAVHNTV